MKVGFHPAASEELQAAAADYERFREGLGARLIYEVESMCGVLAEHPSYGRRVDGIHRQAPLRRFPFLLVYRHDAAAVLVVAVAHKRRRPRYWQSRVSGRR